MTLPLVSLRTLYSATERRLAAEAVTFGESSDPRALAAMGEHYLTLLGIEEENVRLESENESLQVAGEDYEIEIEDLREEVSDLKEEVEGLKAAATPPTPAPSLTYDDLMELAELLDEVVAKPIPLANARPLRDRVREAWYAAARALWVTGSVRSR